MSCRRVASGRLRDPSGRGRMPGHMNVLLAEAQVPYEQLKEMDEINARVQATRTWLWSSAPTTSSIRRPRRHPGAPIYGMPILHADQARQVVFMKRSMRPGFAGIENELLFDPRPHCCSATPGTH